MTTLYALGAVTVADYRLRTADATSAASAVSAALVEAEQLLEEELRRELALESRTDDFPIYPDGRLYPDAWPITVATLTISGRALLGASPDSGPFVGVIDCEVPLRATVTWTGGFTIGTLPLTLAHAIYDLAKFKLSGSAPAPVGASSASVGDASVTWDTPPATALDAMVPGLTARIKPYRNVWV